MSILTASGRTAIAASIKDQPIHLAWGKGDPTWEDAPPPEDIASTSLIDEVGRRVANEVYFCMPDSEGELIASNGRYRIEENPTNHLYMRFIFDFEDAAEATIRELGVMIGTIVKPEVPAGKFYIEPQEIENVGTLLVLEHSVPLIRTAATREEFTFVVTF